MDFKINFSWSIDEWLDVIRQFLVLCEKFFADYGFPLFADKDEEDSGSSAT